MIRLGADIDISGTVYHNATMGRPAEWASPHSTLPFSPISPYLPRAGRQNHPSLLTFHHSQFSRVRRTHP
ncbi:MAG TPA: hypothetical protein DDW68_00840 [Verrucomicrobiales bacterium]|nr:hypothetical protein [Verrucomicrobiales bacterium]HBE95701.1 hypothetical protein [Verrucomicrobiales bacterium]